MMTVRMGRVYRAKRLELANAISAAIVDCKIEEARQDAEKIAQRIWEKNSSGYEEHMNVEIERYRSM